MAPDNKNKDDLENPPGGKYIENVEDQTSDSEGWLPGDFEIQLIGHSHQTYSENGNVQEDETNLPYNDSCSESSWPDTDDEYQEKNEEQYFEGYTSIPLIIEESKSEDKKKDELENTGDIVDSSTGSMTTNTVINTVKSESESVHLSSKDFDYTPVGKRELILDDEKIFKIKDVMKKINIAPPPWASKIDDDKLCEIIKEIVK